MLRCTAALIEKNGKILLALRKPGKHMGRKWEFPGGKIQPGENPVRALQRELEEEFAVRADIGELLASARYRRAPIDLKVTLYRVVPESDCFVLREHEEIRWVEPAEVDSYDLVDSDRKLFHNYLSGLTE